MSPSYDIVTAEAKRLGFTGISPESLTAISHAIYGMPRTELSMAHARVMADMAEMFAPANGQHDDMVIQRRHLSQIRAIARQLDDPKALTFDERRDMANKLNLIAMSANEA